MDNVNIPVDPQPEKDKKFFSVPKVIFVILGLIVLVEIIYAVRTLTSNPSSPALPQSTAKPVVQLSEKKISLKIPKTIYQVNETVPVTVTLQTASEISGVDLIVRFDPKILEATPAGLIKGSILDEYPLLSVDTKQGLIAISGVSSLGGKGFKGIGQFATINFKTKMSGKTSLTIDFKKGSTADSNLVDVNTSKDILEQVDNLEFEVQ